MKTATCNPEALLVLVRENDSLGQDPTGGKSNTLLTKFNLSVVVVTGAVLLHQSPELEVQVKDRTERDGPGLYHSLQVQRRTPAPVHLSLLALRGLTAGTSGGQASLSCQVDHLCPGVPSPLYLPGMSTQRL